MDHPAYHTKQPYVLLHPETPPTKWAKLRKALIDWAAKRWGQQEHASILPAGSGPVGGLVRRAGPFWADWSFRYSLHLFGLFVLYRKISSALVMNIDPFNTSRPHLSNWIQGGRPAALEGGSAPSRAWARALSSIPFHAHP